MRKLKRWLVDLYCSSVAVNVFLWLFFAAIGWNAGMIGSLLYFAIGCAVIFQIGA